MKVEVFLLIDYEKPSFLLFQIFHLDTSKFLIRYSLF